MPTTREIEPIRRFFVAYRQSPFSAEQSELPRLSLAAAGCRFCPVLQAPILTFVAHNQRASAFHRHNEQMPAAVSPKQGIISAFWQMWVVEDISCYNCFVRYCFKRYLFDSYSVLYTI